MNVAKEKQVGLLERELDKDASLIEPETAKKISHLLEKGRLSQEEKQAKINAIENRANKKKKALAAEGEGMNLEN